MACLWETHHPAGGGGQARGGCPNSRLTCGKRYRDFLGVGVPRNRARHGVRNLDSISYNVCKAFLGLGVPENRPQRAVRNFDGISYNVSKTFWGAGAPEKFENLPGPPNKRGRQFGAPSQSFKCVASGLHNLDELFIEPG